MARRSCGSVRPAGMRGRKPRSGEGAGRWVVERSCPWLQRASRKDKQLCSGPCLAVNHLYRHFVPSPCPCLPTPAPSEKRKAEMERFEKLKAEQAEQAVWVEQVAARERERLEHEEGYLDMSNAAIAMMKE